jgi:hypothetical protein
MAAMSSSRGDDATANGAGHMDDPAIMRVLDNVMYDLFLVSCFM